jgi:hypothetical protein
VIASALYCRRYTTCLRLRTCLHTPRCVEPSQSAFFIDADHAKSASSAPVGNKRSFAVFNAPAPAPATGPCQPRPIGSKKQEELLEKEIKCAAIVAKGLPARKCGLCLLRRARIQALHRYRRRSLRTSKKAVDQMKHGFYDCSGRGNCPSCPVVRLLPVDPRAPDVFAVRLSYQATKPMLNCTYAYICTPSLVVARAHCIENMSRKGGVDRQASQGALWTSCTNMVSLPAFKGLHRRRHLRGWLGEEDGECSCRRI